MLLEIVTQHALSPNQMIQQMRALPSAPWYGGIRCWDHFWLLSSGGDVMVTGAGENVAQGLGLSGQLNQGVSMVTCGTGWDCNVHLMYVATRRPTVFQYD